jgi:hypothetical protein
MGTTIFCIDPIKRKEFDSNIWIKPTRVSCVCVCATRRNGSKFYLLYELRYVISCVGNFTGEKSCICLNFSPAYEYRNYVENRI